MADPISISSGLLALVGFAFQSSILLSQQIESFHSHQKVVRQLREELKALQEVLRDLQEIATRVDVDLTSLKLPLLRCGKACKEFETLVIKCSAHSGGSRTSFRDWARLQYMGGDIVGFKDMLAGYKSTISIALGSANIRTAAITVKVLKEYQEMITNTTSDLEDHFQKIDNKLQTLSIQGTGISNDDAIERQQMQEERDSTQKCLDICAEVSSHIDQLQPNAFINISAAYQVPVTTLSDLTSPQQVVSDTFKACRDNLANGTARLERRLQDINNRLQNLSLQPLDVSDERVTEQNQLQEEREYIKQGLDICAEASNQANQKHTNVWEDISTGDDVREFLVSTVGDLISARRITLGSGSVLVSGQMSDNSLQQLSQDLSNIGIKNVVGPQTGIGTQFEDRYGAGVKLSSPNLKGAEATRH